jgi:hypothetical protein
MTIRNWNTVTKLLEMVARDSVERLIPYAQKNTSSRRCFFVIIFASLSSLPFSLKSSL